MLYSDLNYTARKGENMGNGCDFSIPIPIPIPIPTPKSCIARTVP